MSHEARPANAAKVEPVWSVKHTVDSDKLDALLDNAGAEEAAEMEYGPNVEAAVINAVSTTIGQWAQGHGFREGWDMAAELEELARAVGDGSIDEMPNRTIHAETLRDAADLMRNLWLMSKLMLVVTEVSEAAESLRKTGVKGMMDGEGNFGEELADTLVRLGDLAHNIGSPLGDETMKKVAVNAKRPHKHGKVM